MGLLDLFKKKKKEIENKTISEENLPDWISNKNKELSESKKEIFKVIKLRIEKLDKEISEEIKEIKNIDLENKKLEKRIQSMAQGNIENYISYLEKLTEKLNKIENLDNIIKDTNLTINEFEEKSKITYEKITYISGKEIKATKNSIKSFLIDLEEILKSNKRFIEESDLIEKIKEELTNLKELEKEKEQTETELKNEAEKLSSETEKLEKQKQDLEDFRNSQEYAQEKKKIQELKSLRTDKDKEIENLSSKIDFKELCKFYHTFEKELPKVKEYRENITEAINQFGIEKLESYLNESKLNNEEISKSINTIKEKDSKIKDFKLEDLTIEPYENKINSTNLEIETIKLEINTKENKLKNIEKSQKNTKNKISKELEKLKITLEK